MYLLLDKGEYLCLLPQHRLALTAALRVVNLGRHDCHEDLHIMLGNVVVVVMMMVVVVVVHLGCHHHHED